MYTKSQGQKGDGIALWMAHYISSLDSSKQRITRLVTPLILVPGYVFIYSDTYMQIPLIIILCYIYSKISILESECLAGTVSWNLSSRKKIT